MPLPALLEPLRAQAESAAVLVDFDGTLAPIVEDPGSARPLSGVPELLGQLGRRYAVVGVISGRPAGFLERHLGHPPGVRLVGLYGLEEAGQPAGPSVEPAELAAWRGVISTLVARASRQAPPGVVVEDKGASLTLHFRQAPEAEAWARQFAAGAADEGVAVQDARMAVELRPPIATDKGTVVRVLAAGCSAACYFGDDLGDLVAFEALSALAAAGAAVARIAVRDRESPPALADAADLVVDGPLAAFDLLTQLAS